MRNLRVAKGLQGIDISMFPVAFSIVRQYRFGIFTANFKVPHQLTTAELFTYLTSAISAAVAINGALLVVPGCSRARNNTHI